jgi:copper chaperone CopZ
MVQKTLVKVSKNLPRSDTLAILFCPDPKSHKSGRIERGLRQTEGIKEVTINPLTHTISIRYDPNEVTVKQIRSILKKLHSDRGTHSMRKKHRRR